MVMPLNETVKMDDLSADEEYMTAAEFEDATRTVVRTLGDNFNLDIIFAGNGAKTDGNTVILPAQDPSKLMTKKQYAVGQGFANHETMHNLCTDMGQWKTEMARLKGEGKKLAMSCANAIEDVRIERAAANLYPGIPVQIASTADYAAKMFLDEYLGNDPEIMKDFKRIGPLAITWRGRQRLGYDSPYMDKALSMLTPEMMQKLDKWCDLIEALPTGASGPGMFDRDVSHKASREGMRLAEIIATEIDEIEEEEDPQQGNGQGGGNGAGGNGQANDPGQGSSNSTSQNHGGSGDGSINRQDLSKRANQSGGGGDPIDVDMDKAVHGLLNQGNSTQGGWRPVSTALDVMVTRKTPLAARGGNYKDDNLSHVDNLAVYHTLSSEVNGKTAVMKRKLERALLSISEADYVTGLSAGALDIRRRGVHIMRGQENIYRKKLEGRAVDTAVSLVVDASGSMSGSRLYLASQVCVALAECLEKTNVSLEVLAFRADCPPVHMVRKEIQDKYHEIVRLVQNQFYQGNKQFAMFHRASPVMMFELKAFADSIRECRISLGAMPHLAGGSTPDGDAILKAATRLMQRKEPKKIMMVMTDGGSGYEVISGNCTEFTKKAINYCTSKLGIHMVGVGIQSAHVDALYKNSVVVSQLEDLDKGIIDTIARMIIGENFRVDNADVSGAAQNYKRRA